MYAVCPSAENVNPSAFIWPVNAATGASNGANGSQAVSQSPPQPLSAPLGFPTQSGSHSVRPPHSFFAYSLNLVTALSEILPGITASSEMSPLRTPVG